MLVVLGFEHPVTPAIAMAHARVCRAILLIFYYAAGLVSEVLAILQHTSRRLPHGSSKNTA